jgi:hypothetical protein
MRKSDEGDIESMVGTTENALLENALKTNLV